MKQVGFTLLELLIIIAIVSTLSVLSVASYSTLNKSKALQAQTEQFIEILELAKKKVNAGEKLRCNSLINYSVNILTSTSYSLIAGCASGDITLATYQLPSTSSLSISAYTNAETAFTPLAGGATTNCIVITDSKLNECRKILVNTQGLISEVSASCSCP